MPDTPTGTVDSERTTFPTERLYLSVATAAISLGAIVYPLSQYVGYFFIAIAFFSGLLYFLSKRLSLRTADYRARLAFPMLPMCGAGVLFLLGGDAGAWHLGWFLAIGSGVLSIAFSRTSLRDQRGFLLYSFLIASVLTLWLGGRNSEWAYDDVWNTLNTVPFEMLLIYVLFHFFGDFLRSLPFIFVITCLRFGFRRGTAAAICLLLLGVWFGVFVLLFYVGHTLLLLFLLPLLLAPHLFRWINFFRGVVTRLSLWVVAVVLFLYGVSFLGHFIDDFYSPQYAPPKPYEALTAGGCAYTHDTLSAAYQNGQYYTVYVCEEELRREWSRYSGMPLNTQFPPYGETLYDGLCAYLASAGHRRDSVGMTFLSSADIDALEHGATSVKQRGRSWFYQMLWHELAHAERVRSGKSEDQSLLYESYRALKERDYAALPIGVVAAYNRWGAIPVVFFVISVLGSLLWIGIKYRRSHAWHVLYLVVLSFLVGHGLFTLYGFFYLLLGIWWSVRYKKTVISKEEEETAKA